MRETKTGARSIAALPLLLVVSPVAALGPAWMPVARPAQAGPPPVAASPNSCLPGTGSRNWCGDGRPATEAKLAGPMDVTAAPDGTLFIADTLNNVIRRVATNGVIATVAGDAMPDDPRPIEPAATASFDQPQGIAFEASTNSLLVADTNHDAIRRVSASGLVTTVVGGPRAVLTRLRRPGDVVAMPGGGMLVSDSGRHRILQISSSGARRVAGTGRPGFTRRIRVGSRSPLRSPGQVAVLGRRDLLIADSGNRAIRWLRKGRLRTLAILKRPSAPLGVAASGGRVLASERSGVLDVTQSPFMRVAGTESPSFTGDGGPALQTALNSPRQLAVAPDGTLLVADQRNDRIRRLVVREIATVAGSDKPASGSASRRLATYAQSLRCEQFDHYQPRYTKLRLLPRKKGPLKAKGRAQIRLRFQTSRVADVLARVLRPGESFQASRDAVKHGVRHIDVRGPFHRRKYRVELWGRSLPDQVPRCDRKRLRVRQ